MTSYEIQLHASLRRSRNSSRIGPSTPNRVLSRLSNHNWQAHPSLHGKSALSHCKYKLCIPQTIFLAICCVSGHIARYSHLTARLLIVWRWHMALRVTSLLYLLINDRSYLYAANRSAQVRKASQKDKERICVCIR